MVSPAMGRYLRLSRLRHGKAGSRSQALKPEMPVKTHFINFFTLISHCFQTVFKVSLFQMEFSDASMGEQSNCGR